MAFNMKGIKNFGEGTPLLQVKTTGKGPIDNTYDSGETTSKGNPDLFIARSTEIPSPREFYKDGEQKLLATEYMKSGGEEKSYRIPVKKGSGKNMGLYTVIDDETGNEVPVDPRNQSVAPSNVVKGVRPGSDYQEAFRKYNKGRKSKTK